MIYASNYFESKIAGLLLGGAGISAPSTLYVALFASNPGESGTEGTEISYTGYERMPVTFTGPTQSSSGLSMQNESAITFAESPSSTNPVKYVGIFDESNNMWLYGELTTQLVIQSGVSPVFQPEALKWTFSGSLSDYYRRKIMNVLIARDDVSAFSPYLALFNGNPNNTGLELQGTNYARMAIAFQLSEVQPASGALQYENDSEITSPTAGPGGWGTLTNIGIMDNEVGGNVFAVMSLRNNATYSITYGDVIGFHAGDLTFSIN